MLLNIEKDKKHTDKVIPMSIHGKYPYKMYLEILGNSSIGRYIVIVSEKEISKNDKVDSISIRISNNSKYKARANYNSTIVKPNTSSDGYMIRYRVKEINILEVGETPIFVYRKTK